MILLDVFDTALCVSKPGTFLQGLSNTRGSKTSSFLSASGLMT